MLAIDRPRRLNVTIFTSFSFQSHITLGLWRWSIVVILHQIKKPINKLILSLVQLLFGNWHRWDRKKPKTCNEIEWPSRNPDMLLTAPWIFLGWRNFSGWKKTYRFCIPIGTALNKFPPPIMLPLGLSWCSLPLELLQETVSSSGALSGKIIMHLKFSFSSKKLIHIFFNNAQTYLLVKFCFKRTIVYCNYRLHQVPKNWGLCRSVGTVL